jgi:hypothetical protein
LNWHHLKIIAKTSKHFSKSLTKALQHPFLVHTEEHTKQLLAQAQQHTEEMRQNMEELTATQEEMARKDAEYIDRIKELTKSVSNWRAKWEALSQ